jgi:TolA-binding protein
MAAKHSSRIWLLCLILVSLLTPLSFAGPSSQTIKAVAADPAGLVGHYPFEGNAINTSGLAPAGNGILVGGPTFRPGVFGQAIDLDGSGGYVNCGNGSLFNLTKQLTIAAWIKVNSFDRKYQTIISKGDNSWRLARAGDSDSIEFACNGTAATKWDGVGEVSWAITGSTSVNHGEWHHIAGLFDGSALYLYIDGILEAAKAGANSVDISAYEVRIGENAQVPGRQWNGLIDDVRIHNYALSQAEIVSLMGKSQITLPEPVPATLYNIAKKYNGLRKYEEAKGVCELILKQYPKSSPASNAQIYLSKRNILSLIESKDYAKAQETLDKLVADFVGHPDLPEAMYAIAERYELPGKYEEARSLYEQIVQLYPDSPYAAKARYDGPEIYIFSLIASGKYIEGQQAIDKFVVDFGKHPKSPGSLYWFAKRLDAAGQYEQARNIYQDLAWQYPNDAHATKALIEVSKVDALTFIESGDDAAAQKVVDNLIADFTDNPDLPDVIFRIADEYYNRAIGHKRAGRDNEGDQFYRKAIVVWEKMIQYLPLSAEYTPRAYWCSAVVYSQELREYAKGIEYYQHIIDNWPKYKYAWHAQFLAGRYYEKLRDSGGLTESEANPKIQQAYKSVIENYPDSDSAPIAALNLGGMYFKSARWADAAHYFELCVERNNGQIPNHVFTSALYDLARSYEEMGKLDIAVEMYRIFIEIAAQDDPRIEIVRAKLEKLEGAKK